MRLHQGDVAGYAQIRQGAWHWFQAYPPTNNVWVGYFEDVVPSMENMNQVIPLEFARAMCCCIRKGSAGEGTRGEAHRVGKGHSEWLKYVVHGATVTTEQGDGIHFCCNLPNQCCDSHTARLAAVEALYFAKTGDPEYREAAFRSFNWVTYFRYVTARWRACAVRPKPMVVYGPFADGPRRLMDAFWAVPEWAPTDETHLLGASSVVTKISYGKGLVTYSTFDAVSTDVLRVDFLPDSVTANGRALPRRKILPSHGSGFVFDESTRVLRIRHDGARDVDVQGKGGAAPPQYVTFDDPHSRRNCARGSVSERVMDWPPCEWKIGVPGGKLERST